MHHAKSLFYTLWLTAVVYGNPEYFGIRETSKFQRTCNQIGAAISNASEVFFICSHISWRSELTGRDQASPQYSSDISHTYVSSSEDSACSVEPGSAEDVSNIVSYDSPFLSLSLTLRYHSYVSWVLPVRLSQ